MGLFFNRKPQVQELQEATKNLTIGDTKENVYSYLQQSFGRFVISSDGENIESEMKIAGAGTIHYYMRVMRYGPSSQILLRIVTSGISADKAVDEFVKGLKKKFSVTC